MIKDKEFKVEKFHSIEDPLGYTTLLTFKVSFLDRLKFLLYGSKVSFVVDMHKTNPFTKKEVNCIISYKDLYKELFR